MLLFLDTADMTAIDEFAFLIDGITTTPTIIKRAGIGSDDFVRQVRTKYPELEVHIEALAKTSGETLDLIRGFCSNDWYESDKIVFKVPISVEGLKATHILEREMPAVKVNLHMAFSAAQASLAMHARPAYIAPLIGRYADRIAELSTHGKRSVGADAGYEMLAEIMECKRAMQSNSIVLASSIRSVHDFVIAVSLGADAVTLPPSVLAASLDHPMTQEGVEIMRSNLD